MIVGKYLDINMNLGTHAFLNVLRVYHLYRMKIAFYVFQNAQKKSLLN